MNSRRVPSTAGSLLSGASRTKPPMPAYHPGSCCWHPALKGPKNLGVPLGNWLTTDQARALWQVPDANTLKGKRDRALLRLLLGCGLRRKEAAELDLARLERRDDHWATVDPVGTACPDGARSRLGQERNRFMAPVRRVSEGRVFRCVCRAGKTWEGGRKGAVVWHVVKECAKRAAIENLAPHDLSNVRSSMPRRRRGVGPDPISSGSRLCSDDRALSRLQAANSRSRERPHRHRTVVRTPIRVQRR